MSSQNSEHGTTTGGSLSNFVGGSYVATEDGSAATLIDPSTGEGYLEACLLYTSRCV